MLRRAHKKAKKGAKCEECRRRHIRCDQRRPCCLNCTNAERTCTYRLEAHVRPPSSATSPTPTSSLQGGSSPHAEARTPRPEPGAPLVDLTQLRLFHHLISGTFLFLGRDNAITDGLKEAAISLALSDAPLMHAVLAFSARHLSTQAGPDRSRHYLDQSARLQGWALARFDPAPTETARETCLASFFFSSLLAIHALADLSLAGLEPPEAFFIRFGQYVELCRGVRVVVQGHSTLPVHAELQPVLRAWESLGLGCCRGTGPECDGIRQLVGQTASMSPEAADACYRTIERLQYVVDEWRSRPRMPTHCIYIVLAWPLLVDDKFIDLLVLRRQVALVILAYHGAMMHNCDVWVFGRAGKDIVSAVNSYLGPGWAAWLRWPCELVGIGGP